MAHKNWLIFFVLFSSMIFSQVPTWQWAKNSSGANSESGNSICTDPSGNSFVTGYFYSPVVIFGSYTLTNSGNYDFFIVKYDASGNVLWAKSGGGIYDDVGLSVGTDGAGNVIVTGYFYSPTISIGTYSFTNQGIGDGFIVKYNSSGNELWAKTIGGTDQDNALGLATDYSGNIYVTGFYKSPSLVAGSATLTNNGSGDVFIYKLNTNGNLIWAKNYSGAGDESGNALTTDNTGNVYLTGYFYGSSLTVGGFVLTSKGSSDIFTIKMDGLGNEIWAASVGGTLNETGLSVTADITGNCYVSGNFLSSSITVGSYTLTNSGNNDIVFMKYNAAGNIVWIKAAGGLFDDTGAGIVCDAGSAVYLTGHFHSPSLTIGNALISNSGVGDGYIAKFDVSGNVMWADNIGGSADDGSNCIALDNTGNVFVSGFYNSSSVNFSSTTLTNSGGGDMFIAKMIIPPSLIFNTGLTDQNITVFPNPSQGIFRITGNLITIKTIHIYNSLGMKIYSAESHEPSEIIDLSLQAKGMYYVYIKDDFNTLVKKISVN